MTLTYICPIFTTINAHCSPFAVFLKPPGGSLKQQQKKNLNLKYQKMKCKKSCVCLFTFPINMLSIKRIKSWKFLAFQREDTAPAASPHPAMPPLLHLQILEIRAALGVELGSGTLVEAHLHAPPVRTAAPPLKSSNQPKRSCLTGSLTSPIGCRKKRGVYACFDGA